MSASDFSGRLFVPVIARPRRPLSSNASTDSCSMRFSLRTMMSGAFSSSSRRRRLLRLMTRRYRSFKSDVANRPPSSGTSGRRSGGSTGSTVMTIHSGLLFDSRNDSSSFKRFDSRLILVSEFVPGDVVANLVDLDARGSSPRASRGRPRRPCGRRTRRRTARSLRGTPRRTAAGRAAAASCPASTTTKASKYRIRSISRSVMSSMRPMRDGSDFRNQMCATGLASSMWPMRSRRTLVCVTSTPHFSQTTPRCFRRLYLPHKHS